MQRFLDAYAVTVRGDTDLLVVADEDEEDDYAGLRPPERAGYTLLPRMHLGPKLNTVCVPEAERYRAVGFLADDCVPETPGWDALIAQALAAPGIAYPQDHRRTDVPEHQFISSVIIAALGWFHEPSLRHYYTDDVWADLGNATGCLRFVSGASVRHEHYATAPRQARDRTYAEAEENGPADQAAYMTWRRDRLAADADTVRAAIRA